MITFLSNIAVFGNYIRELPEIEQKLSDRIATRSLRPEEEMCAFHSLCGQSGAPRIVTINHFFCSFVVEELRKTMSLMKLGDRTSVEPLALMSAIWKLLPVYRLDLPPETDVFILLSELIVFHVFAVEVTSSTTRTNSCAVCWSRSIRSC